MGNDNHDEKGRFAVGDSVKVDRGIYANRSGKIVSSKTLPEDGKVIHKIEIAPGVHVPVQDKFLSKLHEDHEDTHPDANDQKKAKLSALKKGKYRPPGASSEEMNRPAQAKALEPWEQKALVNKLLGRRK